MDGLRWLLLLIGVLVVAGVYWYSRRDSSATRERADSLRREPSLGGLPRDEQLTEDTAIPADAPSAGSEPHAPETPADEQAQAEVAEKIVTLRLVAGRHGSFAGDELALGLRRAGLRHGKFGIFHRYVDDDENRIVFSAASLVEPGTFDLANLKEQRLPGISLFLVLPGPVEGAEAFDMMMEASRSLAQSLNGELLDESGSTLSIQRERYMREEIIQYKHGIMVA